MLTAGRARIPVDHARRPVRPSTPRPPAGSPAVDADARAYLLLRPYLRASVRVGIDDPADPTPYWLVSTRRPERLAAALVAAAPLGRAAGLTGSAGWVRGSQSLG